MITTHQNFSPVVEVKPEDLQEIKQEPADENDNADSHCYMKQEPTVGYGIVGSCFTIQVSSFTFTFMLHLFPGHRCPRVEQFTVICHVINHRRHCQLPNDI